MAATFIAEAIAMAVVYLYGSIGESIIEKGGSLNLGIPGIMALGALGGVIGVNVYYTCFSTVYQAVLIIFCILFAFLLAASGGALFALFTVTYQANQNVTGLVLTTFGVGLMQFIGTNMDTSHLVEASKFVSTLFTGYESLGWFGTVFCSYGILVYLAIILAIGATIFLSKSKHGLYLRAVGESPATADSQGISVARYRYLSVIIGSGIAGLGGLYYVLDKSGGTTFVEANIEAFGWMAIALVIFSMWKPGYCMIGSFLFGALYILPSYLSVSNVMLKFFEILPYLFTIIVLIITSLFKFKSSRPPKSLGVNYYREDR